MVDFGKMREDRYNRSTPEERARIDAHREQEARYDLTRQAITATFTRIGQRPAGDPRRPREIEFFDADTRTCEIEMRIEDYDGRDGVDSEIIRFIGATTGYEVCKLDGNTVSMLREPLGIDPDDYVICGGSPRYDRCVVSSEDLIAYIAEMRPQLMPSRAPFPINPTPSFR